MRFALLTTLVALLFTAFAKYVHGSRPANANNGYGPSAGTSTRRPNTSVKINIGASGWMIAHITPSAACLYRSFTSRQVRKNSSSRCSHTPARSSDTQPLLGASTSSGRSGIACSATPLFLQSRHHLPNLLRARVIRPAHRKQSTHSAEHELGLQHVGVSILGRCARPFHDAAPRQHQRPNRGAHLPEPPLAKQPQRVRDPGARRLARVDQRIPFRRREGRP